MATVRARYLALAALLAVVVLVAFGPATSKEMKPGVERWPVKTSLRADADLKHPKKIDYTDLVKLPDPDGVTKNDARYQSDRIPKFPNTLDLKEGDIVSVTAFLHLVASETDGDYHIQISDHPELEGPCMVVEVPKDDPEYVKDSPVVRERAAKVREWIRTKLLKGKEPSTAGSQMQRQVFVQVTGQLFYDDAHVGDQPRGKKSCHRQAVTLWELHPVTDIKFAPR